MRTWCKNHPLLFMGYYLTFYLAFFSFLEKAVLSPDLILHCRLDDLIPFCKYAIVPYYLWFAWIPFTLLYLLWRAPRQEFWRLCLPLFLGMTLALLFCAVVPNGVELRPRYVLGSDIFAEAVRGLYSTDTSTNVCPSIHVFNAVTLDLAYQRSSLFAGSKRRWMRVSSHILAFSIVLSTMLLKQHSVIDVVCGILLALALDALATRYSVPVLRAATVGKRGRRSILERL